MATKLLIDPVTRLEGHLAVKVEVESGKVTKGFISGEMFRGFETILRGRDPLDAQQITQRICGVCPVSHGMASTFAQEAAYNLTPPENGRLMRNLILGANYIQSHIIHFYHLAALDFVDIAAIKDYSGGDPTLRDLKAWYQSQHSAKTVAPHAPFLPRYEGRYLESKEINLYAIKHYVEALEIRKMAHQMVALFAGKIPHIASLVPGGVTEKPTASNIAAYKSMLKRAIRFIEEAYIPDLKEVATAFPEYFNIGKGYGDYLVFGALPETADRKTHLLPSGVLIDGQLRELNPAVITESTASAFFSSPSGLSPYDGKTEPDFKKSGAYSWLKAPRYEGKALEVGPLARILVAYHRGHEKVKPVVDRYLSALNKKPDDLNSVHGRHLTRALECKLVADRCAEWLEQLVPGTPAFKDFDIPATGRGYGLVEAPRGALGHWIVIEGAKIKNYQCVVPSTWNCSPRDENGTPGPVEKSLVGVPVVDEKNPIEVARVIRSFDPCLACAVH